MLADTEDEYDALCHETYLMRPYKAHAGNVTPDNAHAFGRDVLEYGLQVVLNLQSYETDDEAAIVMIELIRGLREWEEEHENSERVSCVFILDEAATWLPQRENESSLSKEKDENKMTLLARLQQTFFRTVRKGRKRGIGFMFATQRPADLDKRCISCDRLILFKQTLPNDLEVYKRMGVDSDSAMALSPGEALILSQTGECELHQFRHRYSPDNSRSPGLASLKKRSQQWTSTSTSTSKSTSSNRPALPLVEVERSGEGSGSKWLEVDPPLRHLSEREKQIGAMFFEEGKSIGEIIKELYPGVSGGTTYQKANSEVTDAIRKYAGRGA